MAPGCRREHEGRPGRDLESAVGRPVITRCITRSPVSSAQLKVSHREVAAVGEMGVPINVGSAASRETSESAAGTG